MNDGRDLHELALGLFFSLCIGVLFFLFTGCGGGGGASSPPVPPVTVPLPVSPEPRWFGYYGDGPAQLAETRGHVNMAWIAGWRDPQGRRQDVVIVERAVAAHEAGKRIVLMLPVGYYEGCRFNSSAIPMVRGILATMGPARSSVAGIFPIDEPDQNCVGHNALMEGNSALRVLMREFPELNQTKLVVIYAGVDNFPGIESYDWVSFDDYRLRAGVLGEPLERLLSVLRPDQRGFLIAGGADMAVGGRDDPGPFLARLQADPRLIGLLAFIHIDNAAPGVFAGIRSNGMAPTYCAAAATITGGTCP